MTNGKQSIEESQLDRAVQLLGEAGTHIVSVISTLQSKPIERPYQTPQWHHTVLWTGFAFVMGMLLGGGLMAQ